jgi:hypothetical protein
MNNTFNREKKDDELVFFSPLTSSTSLFIFLVYLIYKYMAGEGQTYTGVK